MKYRHLLILCLLALFLVGAAAAPALSRGVSIPAPAATLSKAQLLTSLERSADLAALGWSMAIYTAGPESGAARYFAGREEAFRTALDLARQLPEPIPAAPTPITSHPSPITSLPATVRPISPSR